MGQAYSWSESVYIWLGNDDENGAANRPILCLKLASQLRVYPPGLPWLDRHRMQTVFRDRLDFFKRTASLALKGSRFGEHSFCWNSQVAGNMRCIGAELIASASGRYLHVSPIGLVAPIPTHSSLSCHEITIQ